MTNHDGMTYGVQCVYHSTNQVIGHVVVVGHGGVGVSLSIWNVEEDTAFISIL